IIELSQWKAAEITPLRAWVFVNGISASNTNLRENENGVSDNELQHKNNKLNDIYFYFNNFELIMKESS
ncbi:hypothetical protein J4V40_24655, partial [Escherichia coli]